MVNQKNLGGKANIAIRASNQVIKMKASVGPLIHGFPVQFCTAVSKKTKIIAPIKPNNISCACHKVVGIIDIIEICPDKTSPIKTCSAPQKLYHLKKRSKSMAKKWHCLRFFGIVVILYHIYP